MRKDNKKALYESIMTSVAREVKKVLNNDSINEGILDNIKTGFNAYKDAKDKDENENEKNELTKKLKDLINNNALLFAQAIRGQVAIAQIMDKLGAEKPAEDWRKRRVELVKFLQKYETFWKNINLQLDKLNQQ